ncbi:MAG: hypothetical protein HYV27_24445 [Candidatus Hydrogenedentes bacterium]|nr:hypothetical protein [Candidatus Hydrogenedentota bacterium]
MKVDHPGSMLDNLMRQTRVHHVQLSMMADMKANMMLTVASIVLTYSVGYLNDPFFQWPALTLIGFCMASVFTAILSAMPRVPLPNAKKPVDRNSPHFNLLFFGSFIHLSYDEFCEEMEKMLNDDNLATEQMVRELYSLGAFLAYRKYRYLYWSYSLFIGGLLCAGLVQIGSVVFKSLGYDIWHFGGI